MPNGRSERRLWVVSKEDLGGRAMSPSVRLSSLTSAALKAGFRPKVVCTGLPPEPRGGIEFEVGISGLLDGWRPGEPVVLDAYVPGRWLHAILGSPVPFDVDFYCLSLPESAERFAEMSAAWRRRERTRRVLKYGWIARAARVLYVSTMEQGISLTGMVAAGPDNDDCVFAARLPTRLLELPLGVPPPDEPDSTPENPYPAALRHRPIVLWGGGVWPWFDMGTILDAFSAMPDKDDGPLLWFLSGSNNRADASADNPIAKFTSQAREMGLLGRNIFFNDIPVEPGTLRGWVHHAALGIMANPDSWEARVSWRTRYLDLVRWGVPLVAAGADPLARRMEQVGGARLVDSGNHLGLLQALLDVAEDRDLRNRMGKSLARLREDLGEEAMASRWLQSLARHDWSPRAPWSPSLSSLARFRLGR